MPSLRDILFSILRSIIEIHRNNNNKQVIFYSPSFTEDEILLDWRIYNTIVNRESFFHLLILSVHYLFSVLSKGTFYFAFSNNLTFSSFFESDRKSSRTKEHERGIVHHDHDFCMSYFCSLDLLSRFKNFEAGLSTSQMVCFKSQKCTG